MFISKACVPDAQLSLFRDLSALILSAFGHHVAGNYARLNFCRLTALRGWLGTMRILIYAA